MLGAFLGGDVEDRLAAQREPIRAAEDAAGLCDGYSAALEAGLRRLSAADREATMSRILATTDKAKLGPCDLVIEAATENEQLKVKILKDICATLNPRGLIATNTSSISITRLAATTDRVLQTGLHLILGGAISVGMLAYLIFALLRPEKF